MFFLKIVCQDVFACLGVCPATRKSIAPQYLRPLRTLVSIDAKDSYNGSDHYSTWLGLGWLGLVVLDTFTKQLSTVHVWLPLFLFSLDSILRRQSCSAVQTALTVMWDQSLVVKTTTATTTTMTTTSLLY